jgi:hypothetical protein
MQKFAWKSIFAGDSSYPQPLNLSTINSNPGYPGLPEKFSRLYARTTLGWPNRYHLLQRTLGFSSYLTLHDILIQNKRISTSLRIVCKRLERTPISERCMQKNCIAYQQVLELGELYALDFRDMCGGLITSDQPSHAVRSDDIGATSFKAVYEFVRTPRSSNCHGCGRMIGQCYLNFSGTVLNLGRRSCVSGADRPVPGVPPRLHHGGLLSGMGRQRLAAPLGGAEIGTQCCRTTAGGITRSGSSSFGR